MSRQFFVGGNFKLNPTTLDAQNKIVQTLNDATLDPNVGASLPPRACESSGRG